MKRSLAVVALTPLVGCTCGSEYVASTTFGAGSVSVALSELEAGGGVAGDGGGTGWDPEEGALGFDRAEPGGALEHLSNGTDVGHACVLLRRTDTTACPASTICVAWSGGRGELNVAPYLYDEGGARSIGTEGRASSFEQPSVATGSLTVDRVEWDAACGASRLVELSWAFEEDRPVKNMESYECM